MIFVEDVRQLGPTIERVKAIEPKLLVRPKWWDLYDVQSQSKRNEFYQVFTTMAYENKRCIACSCWPGKKDQPCFHIVMVIDLQSRMYRYYPDKMIFDEDYMINWSEDYGNTI